MNAQGALEVPGEAVENHCVKVMVTLHQLANQIIFMYRFYPAVVTWSVERLLRKCHLLAGPILLGDVYMEKILRNCGPAIDFHGTVI